MKITRCEPPRRFSVGLSNQIEISDCGEIQLSNDEQVTFVKDSGARYDFAAKSWGYYATPSINGRLKQEGFKTALVANSAGRIYVMVVEVSKLDEFSKYCLADNQMVLEWLDERGSKS